MSRQGPVLFSPPQIFLYTVEEVTKRKQSLNRFNGFKNYVRACHTLFSVPLLL